MCTSVCVSGLGCDVKCNGYYVLEAKKFEKYNHTVLPCTEILIRSMEKIEAEIYFYR